MCNQLSQLVFTVHMNDLLICMMQSMLLIAAYTEALKMHKCSVTLHCICGHYLPMLLCELFQLETFLRQRLVELSMGGTGALSGAILQSAPESLNLDREKVAAMLEEVSALLDRLTTQKMVDLLLIRSFPRSTISC